MKDSVVLILLLLGLISPVKCLVPSSRRQFIVASSSTIWMPTLAHAATTEIPTLTELIQDVKAARQQLDAVPSLIEQGKWDGVRAILIQPPLSDCWTKSKRPYPLLTTLAEKLGDAGGDELGALEAKEEAISHLRYLDMAVYNNVFNPIATEGTTGATKELIRSYFEDPKNEFQASKQALDDLISLTNGY